MASEPHQTEDELAFATSSASAKPCGVIARKTIFLTDKISGPQNAGPLERRVRLVDWMILLAPSRTE